MKIFFYIIILFIIVAISTYFVNPELFKSVQNRITSKINNVIPIVTLTNNTTIYKWKNNNGEVQISNSPPPKGVQFITEQVQHNINIMPSEALTGKTTKK